MTAETPPVRDTIETPEDTTMPSGYFVSSGSYSDYSVVAAFTTRAKAEAYVAATTAMGMQYRSDAGEWEQSTHRDGYEVEETAIDPVFGERGCYVASLSIEGTQSARFSSPVWMISTPRAQSYWAEEASASDPATSMRNTFYGNTSVTGYGPTREAAFAAAMALRERILSGEVDPPWPEYYKGPCAPLALPTP